MKKGVSLITLVITIVVIIILSWITIYNLIDNNLIESAKESKYKSDLKSFDEEIRMSIQKEYINNRSIINKRITSEEEIKKYSKKLVKSEYIKYSYISEGMLTLKGKMLTQKQRKWAIEAKIKIDDTIDIEGTVQILLTPLGETVKVRNIYWTKSNVKASISYEGEENLNAYVLQYKVDDSDFVDYTEEIEIDKNSTIVARLYNKADDDEAASNSKDITNIDKTPPTVPVNVEVSTQINTITLKASGSIDKASGLKGYKYSVDGVNYTKVFNENEECIIDNLKSNETYVIYAKAVDFVKNESEAKTVTNVNTKPQEFLVSYDANGGSGAPANQIKYEAQDLTLTTDSPTKIGYNFKGWATEKDSTLVNYTSGGIYSLDESITLYAVWEASTNTKYSVNYYIQDIGTNTYTLNSSEQKTGTTATKVQVSSFVKSLEGFKYKESKVATITVTEAVISADGSLVINMYYTRNYTQVTFMRNYSLSDTESFTKKYIYYENSKNRVMSNDKNWSIAGYTLIGWSKNKNSTTAEYTIDNFVSNAWINSNTNVVTLYAIWKPNEDTKYTINHYTKNIGSNSYALNSSEQKNGTTGTKVQVSSFVKTINGFTYSNSKVANVPVTEAIISGDGSLVINMYYTRNSYTVTLNKGTGISSVSGAGSYEYGASVTINAVVATGYTWSSWTGTTPSSNAKYTFTMHNSNVTNTANATTNTNTKYIVNYYTKNIGSSNYSLYSSEQKTGTTATKVQVSSFSKTITGFTYSNSKVANVPATEAIISGDGSLVINMYYTRNSYTVTLNKGTGISSVSGAGSYEYGALVTINAVVSTGYTWSSWTGTYPDSSVAYTFTMPNSNVTNIATANPITYTVVYNGNGATSGATVNSVHTYNVARNLTANGYEKLGYTFIGWNTNAAGTGTTYANSQSVANLTSVNDGVVTLYAIWQPPEIKLLNGRNYASGGTGWGGNSAKIYIPGSGYTVFYMISLRANNAHCSGGTSIYFESEIDSSRNEIYSGTVTGIGEESAEYKLEDSFITESAGVIELVAGGSGDTNFHIDASASVVITKILDPYGNECKFVN